MAAREVSLTAARPGEGGGAAPPPLPSRETSEVPPPLPKRNGTVEKPAPQAKVFNANKAEANVKGAANAALDAGVDKGVSVAMGQARTDFDKSAYGKYVPTGVKDAAFAQASVQARAEAKRQATEALKYPLSADKRARYAQLFRGENGSRDEGTLSGAQVRAIYSRSKLTNPALAAIWYVGKVFSLKLMENRQLADLDKDGMLTKQEFSIGLFWIDYLLENPQNPLPATTPALVAEFFR